MKNLRSWLQRVLRRTPRPGTVTVTLNADTTAYVAAGEMFAWLLENMNADELDNSGPFRPHIAAAWQQLIELDQDLPLLWGGDQA